MDSKDQNVFFVDWSKGAKTIIYELAHSRVKPTGEAVGSFIEYLHDNAKLKYEDVTIIGFSLGAHVAGFAGTFLNSQVNRIIGVDPAGPGFDVNNPENRLNPESAKYTECIHTGFPFGIREPICQTDFYFNSGARQPGCVNGFGLDFVPCSHGKAQDYLLESFETPKTFYGSQCENFQQAIQKQCDGSSGAFMNDPTNAAKDVGGIFHVSTNGQSPYGKGREY